jgi:hypothetical protein
MTKADWAATRILLIFAVLVAILAQLCILLWGGNGALSQGDRVLGLALCFVVLLILLGVEVR